MPKPGRSSKTQAGKGDIGGRIDLAPDMARCPCLARQPTIEEIREGDTHIQQEKAQPPMLRSCTMRLYEEKKKQRNTRQPRQGEAARCREVKGSHRPCSNVPSPLGRVRVRGFVPTPCTG